MAAKADVEKRLALLTAAGWIGPVHGVGGETFWHQDYGHVKAVLKVVPTRTGQEFTFLPEFILRINDAPMPVPERVRPQQLQGTAGDFLHNAGGAGIYPILAGIIQLMYELIPYNEESEPIQWQPPTLPKNSEPSSIRQSSTPTPSTRTPSPSASSPVRTAPPS